MDKFGSDLIKDCATHKIELVEKTPEQKTERQAEIEKAQLELEVEQEKEQKRKDALERLKMSTDKGIIDLLEALGW